MNREKVYVCSPFRVPDAIRQRGARATLHQHQLHVAWAIAMSRRAFEEGFFPVTPHLYLPTFVHDDVPTERHMALDWGLEWMGDCLAVWKLDVHSSLGMKGELSRATAIRIPVVRITIDELRPYMPKSLHDDIPHTLLLWLSPVSSSKFVHPFYHRYAGVGGD